MNFVITAFLLLLFYNCKPKDAVNINWKFSEDDLLLTSGRFNTLDLYVPIDITIENTSDCEIEHVYFFANEINGRYKYLPNFKTSKANLDYEYTNIPKIKRKEKRVLTIYLGYRIKDSVFLESEFKDELLFVKKEYNEKENKYLNDTIKFPSLEVFKKKYSQFANEKINVTSENIEIGMDLNCNDNIEYEKKTITIPK